MFKYSKDGVSVLTVLDTRRAKKSGLFPVKVQVVFRRKQKYYSTGKELSKEDWGRLLKAKSKLLTEIRADIESSFSIIKQQVNELILKGEFSIEALSIRLGRQIKDMNLRNAFILKMEELKDNEQASTYLNYQSALKSLENFGGTCIPLERITVDWLKRCERRWISEGKSYSSISIYFRALKCILNRAVHDGILKESSFPFGKNKYEIPEGYGRKLALTLPEIKKVMSYRDDTKDVEEFRDLWVFSYLCNGINFMDLLFLQYSNIVDGEICFVRSKTSRTAKHSKEIRATITPEMWNIIHKWGNPQSSPQTYIFKYAKGTENAFERVRLVRRIVTKCNRRLKKIAMNTGISQLTTYTARHSFATVLKRAGAKTSYISESLGHSNLSVTENYLAYFEKEERIRNARLLTDFNLNIR
ncbi:site-specific integrase [uncultured Bacteroides sp.]|uniref:site-specific integrase n=1 Tax=uncultured Bacteroides sp. TaxID=162156 RepID=UPI0026752CBA|nr:site-specific integrase [uncultured Bacteroides sp.]